MSPWADFLISDKKLAAEEALKNKLLQFVYKKLNM